MKRHITTWGRSTARAVALGSIAAMAVASAASAVDSEPDYHEEQGTYPDQPGYDDPPGPFDDDTNSGGQNGCSDSADGPTGTDIIKLTGEGIDFGDNTWSGSGPIGVGSVQWAVTCGFYSARVVGTLHLDGVSAGFGRMHVGYFNAGTEVDTRHGGIVRAPDADHQPFSVDISSPAGEHVTEVQVCIEISNNGVDFDAVTCKTRQL